MTINPPVASGRAYETPLEMPQVLSIVVESLRAGEPAVPEAETLVQQLLSDQRPRPVMSDPPFPSSISVNLHRCGDPGDELQQLAAVRICSSPSDRYEEILVADFLRWSTLSFDCSACTGRYIERRNAFTIREAETALAGVGYTSLGVAVGQSSIHGFTTPLVHTAFVRDAPPRLIVVGHIPRSPDEGDASGLPPSVAELRVYFPALEAN